MNSIVCVGDGDGINGEQWNLSGDRRVSIVYLNICPQAVLSYIIIPSVFHKTLSKYTPKNSFKCDFSIWAGPNTFTFWSANFQIQLAPLILYATLVYTSTLKSTVYKIFQIFVILIKKWLLFNTISVNLAVFMVVSIALKLYHGFEPR
jgi:hypothetical protein